MSVNNVSSVNNISPYYQSSESGRIKFPSILDIFTPREKPCSESMHIVDNFVFPHSYQGKINGQKSRLNSVLKEKKKNGFFKSATETVQVSGNIGDNNIEFTRISGNVYAKTPVSFSGKYNNTDFELYLENKSEFFNSCYTVKGTINGEKVEFNFPGSKVPEDKKIQDILTSILVVEGYCAPSANGEFKRLAQSTAVRNQAPV